MERRGHDASALTLGADGRGITTGGLKMLVLSRKVGEVLKVGDNITVMVTKIEGNKVRIGIEAPNDVRIVREEVQKDKEKTDAN